jgi:hypothetical protein
VNTIKVPLLGVWDRVEYLSARHAQRVYANGGKAVEADPEIKCGFCKREILDNEIHLVEFGEKVCCRKCFGIRFKNHRQQWRILPIPSDLDTVLDNAEKPAPSMKEAVDKAVETQDKNVAQIRKASKKQP